jgi:hypothetical protein
MEQRTQFGPDPCPTPGGVILRTVGLVLFLVKHCPLPGPFCKYMKIIVLFYVPSPFFRMPRDATTGGRVGYLYSPPLPAIIGWGSLKKFLVAGVRLRAAAFGLRFYLSSKYSSGTSSSGTSRVTISPSSASPASSTPFTTSASNALPSSSSSSTLSEAAPAIPERP